MEIINFGEAKKLGLQYYFNGKECLNGHIAKRLVVSGTCVACKEEKRKAKAKSFTEEQKAIKRATVKRYRDTVKGRETTRKASITWQKTQLAINEFFKAKERVRLLLLASFKYGGYSKTSRTHEILGASFEEVMQHLNCPNGIPEGYELDHILPMALAYDEASAIKLNHYTNLQLLTKAANLEKRDKLPDGRNARDLSVEEKKELIWGLS